MLPSVKVVFLEEGDILCVCSDGIAQSFLERKLPRIPAPYEEKQSIFAVSNYLIQETLRSHRENNLPPDDVTLAAAMIKQGEGMIGRMVACDRSALVDARACSCRSVSDGSISTYRVAHRSDGRHPARAEQQHGASQRHHCCCCCYSCLVYIDDARREEYISPMKLYIRHSKPCMRERTCIESQGTAQKESARGSWSKRRRKTRERERGMRARMRL